MHITSYIQALQSDVVSNATEGVANRIVFHYENLLILDGKLKNEQFKQFPRNGGVNPAWSGNYKHLRMLS